jgi:WD40 repeat protein
LHLIVSLLQAVGHGCTACLHVRGEAITAFCHLTTGLTELQNNVVTATTTAEAVQSVHIWRIQCDPPRLDSRGLQSACVLRKPAEGAATRHRKEIISICAVPAGAACSTDAAFVTCSKGDSTSNDVDDGEIRLWTSQGTSVIMILRQGNSVEELEELKCKASVSKVIITVNKERHTLIAASYTGSTAGIELWNITSGTYETWDAGM